MHMGKRECNGEGYVNAHVLELSMSGLGRARLVGQDGYVTEGKAFRGKRNLTFVEWR